MQWKYCTFLSILLSMKLELLGARSYTLKKIYCTQYQSALWSLYGSVQHTLKLTHCGIVAPYSHIDLGQHRLRQWLAAWRHQAITWTNVDQWGSVAFNWDQFHSKCLRYQSCVTGLKHMFLNLQAHLPGTNELIKKSVCQPHPCNLCIPKTVKYSAFINTIWATFY